MEEDFGAGRPMELSTAVDEAVDYRRWSQSRESWEDGSIAEFALEAGG